MPRETKFPILYKKNTNGTINQWEIVAKDDYFFTISGHKDGKLVESKPTHCESKNTGKANETTAAEQSVKEAEAKWKKKKKEKYVEDINDIDNSFFVEPMLAKKWEDHKNKIYKKSEKYKNYVFPVYVDKKFNGVRCELHSKGAFSRKGEQFFAIPHIINSAQSLINKNPNLILDGELYNYDKRQHLNRITEIVSVVRKAKDINFDLLEESKEIVQYHVYDGYNFDDDEYGYISTETKFSTRKKALKKLLKNLNYIFCVESEIAYTEEEVDTILQRHINDGEEGAIIRIDGPYENKRSDKLLKYKKMEDAEFEIVNIEEGNGNWKGCAKKIWCKLDNGNTFKSNIRGTQEFCKNVFNNKDDYIGKIITVEFQGYSEYGVPQIPYTSLIVRDYE